MLGMPICPLQQGGPLGHGKQTMLLIGPCSTVLGPAKGDMWVFWDTFTNLIIPVPDM